MYKCFLFAKQSSLISIQLFFGVKIMSEKLCTDVLIPSEISVSKYYSSIE